MDKYTVLRKYFGHETFRPGQESLIDAILSGRDALGILPTGGGKSLCYQVPGLLLEGITLVISPLISLMKDQVMGLTAAGVPAVFLNSSLTGEEMRGVYRQMREGTCKLVYVAPERLEGEGFTALCRELPIALVAVDEAHCISQWGQDFRPSYLRILDFLETLPRRPPLAAFTATATAQVREDILRILALEDPEVVLTGFDRPNLFFQVRRPKDRMAALLELVGQQAGRSGIVYCATRNKVEQVWQALRTRGVPAARYHAGLADRERRENQEAFLYDTLPVMVATNAFGMGIDKSNVSYVIHYNMPKSLEAYYQEAGRAGRDGERAECILLYGPGDVQTAKFLLQGDREQEGLSPAQRQEVENQDLHRLEQMVRYCQTTGCLRNAILDYFGQAHGGPCGDCGNCRTEYQIKDITREAQMVLSCVKRMEDRLGYSLGLEATLGTLMGSRGERILRLGLDELSTYGLLKGTKKEVIRGYLEFLEGEGYLRTDPRHGGISLTPRAREVLFRGARVEMPVPREASPAGAAPKPTAAGRPPLLTALKALRTRLARENQVPAYLIFTNAALADMAAKMPRTPEAFLDVSGVGEKKAEKYGAVFLEEIEKFLEQ